MKVTLTYSAYHLIAVWIHDLPELSQLYQTPIDCLTAKADRKLPEAICAAIESRLITGPRSQNGLIGGRFVPDDTGEFRCIVWAGGGNIAGLPWSLSARNDTFVAGLPDEYIDAVCEGVIEAQPEQRLGSGVLTVDHFAHGYVGSSRRTFKQLGGTLVDLMANSDPTVKELFQMMATRITSYDRPVAPKPDLTNTSHSNSPPEPTE